MIRSTLKSLRQSPGVTAAAIVMLALGMTAAMTAFAVSDAALLRPLPYGDPARLVAIVLTRDADQQSISASTPTLSAWERAGGAFAAVAGYAAADVNLSGGGAMAESVSAGLVSDRFFSTLDVRPLRGRLLDASDHAQARAVIGESLWHARFGGRDDLSALPLVINGQRVDIVGVAAARVALPQPDTAVWLPLSTYLPAAPPQWRMRGFRPLSLIARLSPGASLPQATTEADRVAEQLAAESPRFDTGISAGVVPLGVRLRAAVRPTILVMDVIAALLLLTTCLNVASLLMARGAVRVHELAIHSALGAGRARLVAGGVLEGLLIAGAALAVSVPAVLALVTLAASVDPGGVLPAAARGSVARVLAFGALTSLASAAGCSLWPARLAARLSPTAVLTDIRAVSSARTRFWHAALVTTQVAAAVAVLVIAALLMKTLNVLLRVNVGVGAGAMTSIAAEIDLASSTVRAGGEADVAARLVQRVGAIPGVARAGLLTSLPPNLAQMTTTIPVVDAASGSTGDLNVAVIGVQGDALDAAGISLVAGRGFDASDSGDAPRVVMLSETAANRLFGRRNPVGQTVAFGRSASPPIVVGVVTDVKYTGLEQAADGAIYMPFAQQSFPKVFVVARTTQTPAVMSAPIRDAVRDIDATIAVRSVRTLGQLAGEATAPARFRARLVMTLGAMTAGLVGLGVYGVFAFAVAAERREFGLRAALGATRGRLMAGVLLRALRLLAIGAFGGAAAAWWGARLMRTLLFGTTPADPAAFGAALAAVVAIGLVATLGPAMRASRADPSGMLRGGRA